MKTEQATECPNCGGFTILGNNPCPACNTKDEEFSDLLALAERVAKLDPQMGLHKGGMVDVEGRIVMQDLIAEARRLTKTLEHLPGRS